ncbi:hypothetical protein JNW90_28860 [Micromonospora sp. STR1s_5]|nr:hypothetical protein [Micromonospora sp. STR1s_5]
MHSQRQFLARDQLDPIRHSREDNKALELMVAVVATAQHMKGEVDLCRGARRKHA